MKKIIITLLFSIFLLMPGVKADCVNLVEDNVWYPASYGQSRYYVYYSNTGKSHTTFNLDVNKSYTIYFEDLEPICNSCSFYFFGNTYTITNNTFLNVSAVDSNGYIYFKTSDLSFYKSIITRKLVLVEGNSICNSGQEPDKPIPDSSLSSFYSIFLDKLGYLSNYAVENKFILSAIGIIFLFVILEIILYLFRKGGNH